MPFSQSLSQKRIVIIDGNSDTGLAVAKQAYTLGATVILAGTTESTLQTATHKNSPPIESYTVDLTDNISVKTLFQQIRTLDYLVVTTPEPQFGHFLELDIEQVHQEFERKFWGQYRAVKEAVSVLTAAGSIVLVNGAYSARPIAGATSLAAVQAGIEGLARGLAIDLCPIRVNVISPGVTTNPTLYDAGDADFQTLSSRPVNSPSPQSLCTPDDIAEWILYLLSNPHMTGNTLFPDGGYTLGNATLITQPSLSQVC